MPGDLARVESSFVIKLTDHNITIPKMPFLPLQLDENIKVTIDLIASSAGQTTAIANPCNPCGMKGSNPCNPCAKKKNPCAEKKTKNPCSPCAQKK